MGRLRKIAQATPEDLKLLTPKELAELIGVTPETLRQWRFQRRGPRCVKIGRDARYRPTDVLAWQRQLRIIEPKRL